MQAQEEVKGQSAQASQAEEEKKGEEAVGPKHQQLQEEKGESAELIENRHTKNISSPFIN